MEEFPDDDGVINPYKLTDSAIVTLNNCYFSAINGGLGSIL
jgi:hypothetical protein